MTREIRFRAWNKVWGMIISNEIYQLNIDETGIHTIYWVNTTTDGEEHKEVWENPEDFILMQYTGLKDKNGKKIFEGDILQGKYNGVVEWITENARYAWSGFYYDSEVIGNIYQNPELIEQNENIK